MRGSHRLIYRNDGASRYVQKEECSTRSGLFEGQGRVHIWPDAQAAQAQVSIAPREMSLVFVCE